MKPETAIITGPREDRIGNLGEHRWLGIPTSLAAFAVNLRFFAARRPATPLRVLSLIAIDTASRSRGIAITPERRRAVIEAMELGALLNDRFDGDARDSEALRASWGWFAQSAYREIIWSYGKRLRRLERSRPDFGGRSADVRLYREGVNSVSLALLWALARDKTLANAELEIGREGDLRLLFQIVMQTQLIDDVLDVRLDRRRCLPSFASGPAATPASLRELVSVYSDSKPIRLDRNFCLRVALKIVAAGARVLIALRAAAFSTSTRAASGSR
jgi:hypothetical protein